MQRHIMEAFERETRNSLNATDYMEWTTTASSTTTEVQVADVEFELPFLICICVLGFFGNTLVCLVYTRQKFRRSNAALYILNLAATDLLACLVVLFHVTEFYHSTWPILWAYNIQCQIHRYLRFVGFNSTVFTMMAIAIDRYFAVRNPVVFKAKFTISRTKFILLFVWLSSIVSALPVAFMFESIYSGGGQAITYPGKLPWACKVIVPFGPWWKDFKPVYLNILLFYVPAIITAIIYVRIVLHVRRSNNYLRSKLLNGGPVPKRLRNSHWKTCKSLLYVFVGFIICFAPFATYHIVQQYFAAALHPELKNLSLLLPYLNSCLNPVIYSFTNETFWKSAKQIMCMSPPTNGAKASIPSSDMDAGPPSILAAISGSRKRGGGGEGAMGISFLYERNTVEMDSSPAVTRHQAYDDDADAVSQGCNGTMISHNTRSSDYCMTTIPNGKA